MLILLLSLPQTLIEGVASLSPPSSLSLLALTLCDSDRPASCDWHNTLALTFSPPSPLCRGPETRPICPHFRLWKTSTLLICPPELLKYLMTVTDSIKRVKCAPADVTQDSRSNSPASVRCDRVTFVLWRWPHPSLSSDCLYREWEKLYLDAQFWTL